MLRGRTSSTNIVADRPADDRRPRRRDGRDVPAVKNGNVLRPAACATPFRSPHSGVTRAKATTRPSARSRLRPRAPGRPVGDRDRTRASPWSRPPTPPQPRTTAPAAGGTERHQNPAIQPARPGRSTTRVETPHREGAGAMSNFIVEEERGTYTGRRHPNNGYYAFTGTTTRTSEPRYLTAISRPNSSGHYAPISERRRAPGPVALCPLPAAGSRHPTHVATEARPRTGHAHVGSIRPCQTPRVASIAGRGDGLGAHG